MRVSRLALLGGMLGTLAACGGGGSGIGSTPTPTPTPTAQTNPTLTNLQYSESFTGRAATIQFALSATTGIATSRGSVSNASSQLRYDAASRSYTLTGSLPAATFGPAERDAASSNATITTYGRTNGTRQDAFVLFSPGAGNPQLALTYASYGALQSITTGGSNLDIDTSFFTYGVLTPAADMPKTGAATYQTLIDGLFAGSAGTYSLSGSGQFAADFAAQTVSFTMAPVGTPVLSGSAKSFGTLSGTGRISGGNQFDANASGGAYSAGLAGYFYGPAAAEIGGTFTLSGADGSGVGALVGKKN